MSIKSTDLFLYKAINAAIDDMRKNEYVIEDVVADASADPLLAEIYGEKEIEKFKLFMKKNIQVDMEYNIDMARLPAVGITVEEGTEDDSKTGDALGDGFRQKQINPQKTGGIFKPLQIILGPVTPTFYDPTTGTVTFPSNVSLANVYETMVLFDEVNKKAYPIEVVIDDQNLIIPQCDPQPNFDGMTIRTKKNVVSNTIRSYFFYEKITLTCMASESAELIYLYSLMLYIIGRYRLTLFDSKNFSAMKTSYGRIHKVVADPQQVFGREITLYGKVEHTYIERTDKLLQGNKTGVKIATMPETPAGYQQEAEDQGWDSPEDPK